MTISYQHGYPPTVLALGASRSVKRGCLGGCVVLALLMLLNLVGGSACADDQSALVPRVMRVDGSLPRAKVDSALRAVMDLPAGTAIPAGYRRFLVATSRPELLPVRLDVVVNDANEAAITATGAVIKSVSARWNSIRVDATVAEIDALAALPIVHLIAPVRRPRHRSQPGTVSNQADSVIHTDQVRSTYNVSGSGFSVGIISDSINATSTVGAGTKTGSSAPFTLTNTIPQNSGNLPSSISVIDFGTSMDLSSGDDTDEGEAMMEEAYHLAPGAHYFFAACDDTDTEMASNILLLASNGCKIVCDDVGFFDEPMFQDGPIAQAADSVVAGGGIYLSAAGNSADSGIIQTYSAISGTNDPHTGGIPNGNNFQNWGIGGSTAGYLPITITPYSGSGGASVSIVLEWNQPYQSWSLGAGSQSDYDLYLFASPAVSTTPPGSSLNNQGTTNAPYGDPSESLQVNTPSSAAITYYLAVDRYQGISAGTVLRVIVSVEGGTITSPYYASVFGAGTCYGHPAAASALAIAAVDYTSPTQVESFTSKGGWGSGGLPFYFDNSGNPLSGAPVRRNKPDISAPDGVNTSNINFQPFFGTSAATPNAAAAAVLVWATQPTLTNTQVIDALENTATDITLTPASAGGDAWSGFGLVNAFSAASANLLVSLSSPLGSSTTGLPVSVTATFSASVTGFSLADVTASTGTLGNLSGSGTTYTFVWTPPAASPTHTATLTIPAGTVTASASSTVNSVSNTLSLSYDTVIPAAPVITAPAATSTVGGNFAIHGSVSAGLSISLVVDGAPVVATVSGTSWSASVTGATAGPATISATANDGFGNASPAASESVTVVTTPPAMTFTQPTSPTNATVLSLSGTVDATATMSITDGTTVLGTPTLTASGTPGTDNWTFTTPTLSSATHVLHAIALSTLGNAADVSHSVIVDTVPPTLTLATPTALSVAGLGRPTTSLIAVTYADPYPSPFTLTAGEVILTTTGTAAASVSVDASNNITLSGFTGNGTMSVSIAANAATDTLGNMSLQSGPTAAITVGIPPLSAVLSSPTPVVTASLSISALLTFSAATTTTVHATDFSPTNCTITPGAQTSSTTYAFTIVPNAHVASFSVDYIGNGTVQSLSGAAWSGTSNTLSFTTATAPVLVAVSLPSSQATTSTGASVFFLATFSQTVTALTSAHVTVTGSVGGTLVAAATNPSNDNMTYLVTVSGMASPGGTVILNIPADVVNGVSGGQPNSTSTGSGNVVTWSPPTAGAAAVGTNSGSSSKCSLGAGVAGLVLALMAFLRTTLRSGAQINRRR